MLSNNLLIYINIPLYPYMTSIPLYYIVSIFSFRLYLALLVYLLLYEIRSTCYSHSLCPLRPTCEPRKGLPGSLQSISLAILSHLPGFRARMAHTLTSAAISYSQLG